MKKVEGTLNINAYIDCPRCRIQIDLFEIEHLTDDGYLHGRLLSGDRFGTENLDEVIECPNCGTKFMIGEIL